MLYLIEHFRSNYTYLRSKSKLWQNKFDANLHLTNIKINKFEQKIFFRSNSKNFLKNADLDLKKYFRSIFTFLRFKSL